MHILACAALTGCSSSNDVVEEPDIEVPDYVNWKNS